MQQAKNAILAHSLLRLLHNNKIIRLISAAILPFLGVVAAFGIAPDTVTEKPVVTKVIEEVALPALDARPAPDETYWREERMQRGDTLATVLARLQVDDPAAVDALRSNREARLLHHLRPGKTIRARVTAEGELVSLSYLGGSEFYTLERAGEGFTVSRVPAQIETRTLMKSGEIKSSLFAAADAADLPDAIALQIADIFSTDIDFHRDLRRGDRFSVVYEALYHQGDFIRTGRVLAAEFTNQGKVYQAVYFENSEGQGGYYTLDGRNIRKAFLRSPLEFSRISSGFTAARFHPVLKTWRAHRGIDYAAPAGTRVKATADGVVEFLGWHHGGYGNLIVLRHQSKYTTWYAHLSGFATGLRRGSRVSQGDVIGYVGATGLATGPHLHYELRINDVYQDPLRVAMPPAPPISAKDRAAFEAQAQAVRLRLDALRTLRFARLD